MFVSIIVKGLPKKCKSFTTLVKYSKDGKTLKEIKRDLLNFDNESIQKKNRELFSTRNGNIPIAEKKTAMDSGFYKTAQGQIIASPMRRFESGEQ